MERFRFCVAPMMDLTDRHCRFFHRLLSRRTRLYTEMLTTGAVIYGDRETLLGFDQAEHPVALQLGGSDPATLAEAARIGEGFGYDEINLNVGCPSDRVRSGRFGACLMREPDLVGACVAALKAAVAVPVTVKCRIGVDDQDPEPALDALADSVLAAGGDALFVHARKAWLAGLSPKENRDVPPLDYPRVYRLKQRLRSIPIAVNGGVLSLAEARAHLNHVDGVMIGRAAYHDPWLLSVADPLLFGEPAPLRSREEAVEAFLPHVERELRRGVRLSQMTRHILGLYGGLPGARAWRRILTVESVRPGAGTEVIRGALAKVPDRLGDAQAAIPAVATC